MDNIVTMLSDLDIENLPGEVKKELENGTDPQVILKWCQEAMNIVGDRFASGVYFISDLMMSGMLFKQVNEALAPYFVEKKMPTMGNVVIGTVKKDVHDLGKDLVHVILTSNGFDVTDLGVDVPADRFVHALKETGSKVLALSCLLATCYDSILDTVEAVKAAGLRDQTAIIIGGGPVDSSVVKYSGADAFGSDPQAAVRFCRKAYDNIR